MAMAAVHGGRSWFDRFRLSGVADESTKNFEAVLTSLFGFSIHMMGIGMYKKEFSNIISVGAALIMVVILLLFLEQVIKRMSPQLPKHPKFSVKRFRLSLVCLGLEMLLFQMLVHQSWYGVIYVGCIVPFITALPGAFEYKSQSECFNEEDRATIYDTNAKASRVMELLEKSRQDV